MQPSQFASAGNAMETSPAQNPVGLYKQEASGKYVGCLDAAAADAAVRVGFQLVEVGRDAAMKTDAELYGQKTQVTIPEKVEVK